MSVRADFSSPIEFFLSSRMILFLRGDDFYRVVYCNEKKVVCLEGSFKSEKIFIIIIIKDNNQMIIFLPPRLHAHPLNPPTRLSSVRTSPQNQSPLLSANRRFALRFGKTYLMMHMKFYGGWATPAYWKHTALTEATEQEDNASSPAYDLLNDSADVRPAQRHDHLFIRVVPRRRGGGDRQPLRPRRQRRQLLHGASDAHLCGVQGAAVVLHEQDDNEV
jgi:hypothetical protein